MRISAYICVTTITLLMALLISAPARADDVSRAELIRIQNALRTLREFEQDCRHLYFLQANAVVAGYGGWNEGQRAYGTHADLLGEAAESIMLPKFKRLAARAASNDGFSEEQGQRLQEAAEQMVALVMVSRTLADALNAGDLATAMTLYRDESVPTFEAVWATNFTLISEIERRFPRR